MNLGSKLLKQARSSDASNPWLSDHPRPYPSTNRTIDSRELETSKLATTRVLIFKLTTTVVQIARILCYPIHHP